MEAICPDQRFTRCKRLVEDWERATDGACKQFVFWCMQARTALNIFG